MPFAREALLVAGVVLLAAAAAAAADGGSGGAGVCFGQVFSFGDSLTDTGNFLLSVPEDFPDPARNLPYGQTFFGRPSGRYTDGRNLLDFLAEAFGLPFVPPYLGGGDFQHGTNFAVGGATALSGSFFRERGVEPTWTPHSLDEQLQWFKKLLPSIAPSEPERSDIMSKSLFLVGEVGGNDYNHLIVRGKSLDELHELVPNVVGAISSAITDLINLGAKKLVVPGNFPIGCVPLYLAIFPSHKEDYYDEQTGCIKWLNKFAEYHNKMLQEDLEKLRNLHPDVTIIYADYYGAALNIFRAPLQFGFTVPLNACCGSDAPYNCSPSILCGRPGSMVCSDPSKYISWDGLHFTEATYKIVIQGVLGGYAIPPLSETCKGGEYKISQLHQCTDNPTNTVTYHAVSSFI
ncbi:GDSL esterase/lipase At1g28570-like [Phragmites australis]|uniref:GDSL esterase/lipase At1g28570-like n=1 Tax=Phragmites australis TaxID=29695 RepID=UPI002D794D9D|nr:GDSL esterase/lipase At1g28570-like [Phragmites australis]